jgi:hypothetical protein
VVGQGREEKKRLEGEDQIRGSWGADELTSQRERERERLLGSKVEYERWSMHPVRDQPSKGRVLCPSFFS